MTFLDAYSGKSAFLNAYARVYLLAFWANRKVGRCSVVYRAKGAASLLNLFHELRWNTIGEPDLNLLTVLYSWQRDCYA